MCVCACVSVRERERVVSAVNLKFTLLKFSENFWGFLLLRLESCLDGGVEFISAVNLKFYMLKFSEKLGVLTFE